MTTRGILALGLVGLAWAFALLGPFFSDAPGSYWARLFAGPAFWVPFLVASACALFVPRRVAVVVSCMALTPALYMALSVTTFAAMYWSIVGLIVLAATLVRPRGSILKGWSGRASGPM